MQQAMSPRSIAVVAAQGTDISAMHSILARDQNDLAGSYIQVAGFGYAAALKEACQT